MKKNASFTIDKVSEDSFYANLLLGLPKYLAKCPLITDCVLYRCQPATSIDILSWEHSRGVILPDEMKNFYASTNGFTYTYMFCQDYKSIEKNIFTLDSCVIGKIQVNPLEKLINVYGYQTRSTEKIERVNDTYQIFLSQRSKVFDLSQCDVNSKVVLIYVNIETAPSIWLMLRNGSFSYIARNFSTYLRMCLAHLGVPGWQHLHSCVDAIPEYSKEILNVIAPGVLPEERRTSTPYNPGAESVELNRIDPNIFKSPKANMHKVTSAIATSTNTKAPKGRSKTQKSSAKK